MTTKHFHALKVKEIQKETEDSVSVTFDVPEDLKYLYEFKQGQYITVNIPVDGNEEHRSYSICAAPYEESLKVAVKKIQNGKVSTFLNDDLKVGDEVAVMPPSGNFFIDLGNGVGESPSYVAFAAGSGITPIISIIKESLEKKPQSTFVLYYGNKSEESTIFRKELDSLNEQYGDRFKLEYFYSRSSAADSFHEGRLDEAKIKSIIRADLSLLKSDNFFLCGPERMIVDANESLKTFGVKEDKIKFELFSAAEIMKSEPVEVGEDFHGIAEVTIILDDEEELVKIATSGDSILNVATDAGLDAPYSCKGGVCCTCRCKVEEGKVVMDQNFSLTDGEVADGYVLACQAHPRSEHVKINFDD